MELRPFPFRVIEVLLPCQKDHDGAEEEEEEEEEASASQLPRDLATRPEVLHLLMHPPSSSEGGSSVATGGGGGGGGGRIRPILQVLGRDGGGRLPEDRGTFLVFVAPELSAARDAARSAAAEGYSR